MYAELFDFGNARTAWTHALNREPDNPGLYNKIGVSYWFLAYARSSQASRADLEQAAQYFHSALLLYGSVGFEQQVEIHYRLGKLYTALRSFEAARPHLRIVEASGKPPLVGWQVLGLAHLERHEFEECEYYFNLVIAEGDHLSTFTAATTIVGDRLDEREWPLGFIRAWGYLGRALSTVARDGTLSCARGDVRQAWRCIEPLSERHEFPTRLSAACADCEGLILLKEGRARQAIKKFENAIEQHPHSRSYMHLAWAHERQTLLDGLAWYSVRRVARRAVGQTTPFERERRVLNLRRLIAHATDLRPGDGPPPEADEILARIESLASGSTSKVAAAERANGALANSKREPRRLTGTTGTAPPSEPTAPTDRRSG